MPRVDKQFWARKSLPLVSAPPNASKKNDRNISVTAHETTKTLRHSSDVKPCTSSNQNKISKCSY